MESTNAYTIVGSSFSPFVRRLRLFCAFHNISYNWHPIANLLENEIPEVNQNNPARQIPVLITKNDGAIFDSSVIAKYLTQTHHLKALSWKDEML